MTIWVLGGVPRHDGLLSTYCPPRSNTSTHVLIKTQLTLSPNNSYNSRGVSGRRMQSPISLCYEWQGEVLLWPARQNRTKWPEQLLPPRTPLPGAMGRLYVPGAARFPSIQ